jgi:SRSO17 transposase
MSSTVIIINMSFAALAPEVARISFQSKWAIALEQIRKAVRDGIPAAPALADAAYGDNYDFREGITELGVRYVVGVRERTTIWEPGESPLPPETTEREGAPRHAAPSRPATSTCSREGIGGILGTSGVEDSVMA